jgi:hypothetical protein
MTPTNAARQENTTGKVSRIARKIPREAVTRKMRNPIAQGKSIERMPMKASDLVAIQREVVILSEMFIAAPTSTRE